MGRAPDPERVGRRAAYVREQVERLRELAGITDEAAFTQPRSWLPAAVRYAFQTAIEGLIDIAYHVCARRYAYAAPDARSAFRRLLEAGRLPAALWTKVDAMVGFRNLLVHGYDVVSDAQIYRILRDEAGDIEAVLVSLEAVARDVTAAEGEPTS